LSPFLCPFYWHDDNDGDGDDDEGDDEGDDGDDDGIRTQDFFPWFPQFG